MFSIVSCITHNKAKAEIIRKQDNYQLMYEKLHCLYIFISMFYARADVFPLHIILIMPSQWKFNKTE